MSRLLEEFNVKANNVNYEKNDYLVFKDKELLDEFRIRILEDLSDKGFVNQKISKDLINSEIDEVTYGYDLAMEERNYLYNLIDGEVNGVGPLTYLLRDENITEIMVNSPSDIYIEVDGILRKDNSVSFINEEHIIRTLERLIKKTNKMIDISNPMIDAMLEDGSRLNAVIPPISKNPIITIRKFKKNIVDMDNLVGNGSLTPFMARFLEASVKAKLNILVSGGATSGRTTLVNILGNYIPKDERIITIENIRELDLKQNHVVSLEVRGSNCDGMNEVSMRELIHNSLRMRPDRLIVGDLRGTEAFDVLQAMNTGYEGSIASVYASGCKDALNKLKTIVLMNGMGLTNDVISNYINEAIDIVVHISKMKDGRRKIIDISEVVEVKDNEIILENIFEFRNLEQTENGMVQGEFILQERVPKVLEKIKNAGIDTLDDMFVFKKKKSKTKE